MLTSPPTPPRHIAAPRQPDPRSESSCHLRLCSRSARSFFSHAHQRWHQSAAQAALRKVSGSRGCLIIEYLASRGHSSPSDFFGEDTWRKFGYAVSFRNMLVHECTYLGQDKFPHLSQACQCVLQRLSG